MNRIAKKNIILCLFLAGIVLLMASGIIFYLQFQRMLQLNESSTESYQTFRAINGSIIAFDEASLKVDSFLQSKNAADLNNLPELIITAQVNLSTLNQLISDDIHQQTLFNQLSPLANQRIEALRKIVTSNMMNNQQEALTSATGNNNLVLTSQIKQLLTLIKRLEIIQLNDAEIKYKAGLKNANLFFLSAGIICILVFLLTYVLLRKYIK